MKISMNGLVIWEVKTGEADRVITILGENGLITAYSKGSLRPKNKLTSSTAMLSYSNFELYSGKTMYNIDDAISKERFIALFTDVERYYYASYFCELMKYLAPIDDDAHDYLALMLNTMHLLNERKKNEHLIKPVFEMRLMTIAGYMPDLTGCVDCADSQLKNGYFDMQNGIWYCELCAKQHGKPINCSIPSFAALRHIIYSESRKIFSFEIPENAILEINKLSSKYVQIHIDHSLTTLDFLNLITDRIGL